MSFAAATGLKGMNAARPESRSSSRRAAWAASDLALALAAPRSARRALDSAARRRSWVWEPFAAQARRAAA